jgi:hypothetical protein
MIGERRRAVNRVHRSGCRGILRQRRYGIVKEYNGLGMHMGNLPLLSSAKSRSISAENPTGAPGAGGKATDGMGASAGRDLGRGWKIAPCVRVQPDAVFEVADITGPGAIQHIWMTPSRHYRFSILRIFWDDSTVPSVECPVGDFFACGWNQFAQVSSLAICVNPLSGLNCYWEMPFRKRCRITLANIGPEPMELYYQVDYTLTDVPDNAAYFHAQFRRVNPVPYKEVITLLDGVEGRGQYVGTYMAWGVNNTGWWGEGEIKFFMDDDGEYPTICGTGTEDYFCGSYGFITGTGPKEHYTEFTTPYAGMPQVIRPDGLYASQTRFSLYRWHIVDAIRFQKRLRVTMQALGWRSGGRYLPLQDDVSSVAFWYQSPVARAFPKLPDRDHLEII